jgi:hypothetical protein
VCRRVARGQRKASDIRCLLKPHSAEASSGTFPAMVRPDYKPGIVRRELERYQGQPPPAGGRYIHSLHHLRAVQLAGLDGDGHATSRRSGCAHRPAADLLGMEGAIHFERDQGTRGRQPERNLRQRRPSAAANCQGTRGFPGRRPPIVPVHGREISRWTDTRAPLGRGRSQLSGTTPLPAVASARRSEGPSVATRWAWWRRRSTLAVARVLGMIVSKPAGCRLLVTATLRFS